MFVVYLTYYTGNKLPPWYIGSSYKSNIIDNNYNGSVCSKKYKEVYDKEQKENKQLFKTRILSCHKTRDEAVLEENRLQKKHKVVKSKKYFNESYATKNGCFTRDKTGDLNPMFNKGFKLQGIKNGRHKDNYDYENSDVGEKISKSLKNTIKNKKGKNPASKKYYIYDAVTNTYIDIDKGYLYRFCEIFQIGYNALYNTLKTKKPITHSRKYKNSKSYQLFEGSLC